MIRLELLRNSCGLDCVVCGVVRTVTPTWTVFVFYPIVGLNLPVWHLNMPFYTLYSVTFPVSLVPATSIAPQLSTGSQSDTTEVVLVPEDAANAVFKFTDNSLKLHVGAGMYLASKTKYLFVVLHRFIIALSKGYCSNR